MNEFAKGLMLFIGIMALVIGGAVHFTQLAPSVVERAKAASFELNVNVVLAFYPLDGWEEHWPKFAADTGAILGRPDRRPVSGPIVFYIKGGGTAFFFGQDQNYTYALTNSHVISPDSALAAVNSHPLLKQMTSSGEIDKFSVWLCPNFSNLDEFPTCRVDAEPVHEDAVLDFAVIRFEFGTRLITVTTLALGSYEDVPDNAPLLTVGSGLGVSDLEGPGKKLPGVRAPYILDDLTWRWTIPYDMNTVGGFSGSPVLDLRTGLVIGLHRGAILDPRGSGRAVALLVPMEYIARALIMADFPVTTPLRLER